MILVNHCLTTKDLSNSYLEGKMIIAIDLNVATLYFKC